MTVNLPGYSLDPGEAFISGDISKDLLRFIKENKLGKVLPYQVQSGYGKYSAVAFDLEKLKAVSYTHLDVYKRQGQWKLSSPYPGVGPAAAPGRPLPGWGGAQPEPPGHQRDPCLLYTSRCV